MGGIAGFCIKHKVTTVLAFIIVSIFGVVYLRELQLALLPNMEYPAAYVYCYYNGAAPEDMEQLVTRPLESAVMSVPGVDSINSSSADSLTTIQISYTDGTNVDIAATKLREKMDALTLPEDCTKPVIMNVNVSDMLPTAYIALMGDDLADVQSL
ncbi:MAG: efflux RND transporter permease subunit, partial [Oscillospiraceae bacterium]|nr:efflux RND transporter permease subunit [Oscillospiraceae bacterium]